MFSSLLLAGALAHAQFTDDRARCPGWSDSISPSQKEVIENTMAEHGHRLHHLLWHATRNGWAELAEGERRAVQTLSSEWGRNAPLCEKNSAAGEEFLLMHHEMIDTLRVRLAERGLPCIRAWERIPNADDPNWPIPPGESGDSSKSAEVGRLLAKWGATFIDPAYLKSHSLSEIGYLLEFSIHNNLHMRWATLPRNGDDYSPFGAGPVTAESLSAPTPYDAPEFNWLGNPFSAHVNPVFWKLHGWVDAVVAAWLKENDYATIARDCGRTPKCYRWRSTWTGATEHRAHGGGVRAVPPDPALGRSLQKILPKAGFRNPEFDEFLNPGRGGGGGPPRAPPPQDPAVTFADPATFVERFGPCRR